MKEPGAERDIVFGVVLGFVHGSPFVFFNALPVPIFMGVRHFLEDSREKGVEDRTGEYDRSDQVEVILSNSPFFELLPESSAFSLECFMFGICVGR